MLYEELSNLCPGCTYAQFENIERIYNACPNMGKSDAVKIWRMSYGVEVEQEKRDAENLISQLLSGKASEKDVRNFARNIQAAKKENFFCDTTKSRGIRLRGALVRNVNNGSVMQYALEVLNGGAWTRTVYQYSTPDLYVWTL